MSTVRIVVTGATGQVAYALLPRIAAGEMFGPDAEVDLRLSDIPPVIEKAKGVPIRKVPSPFPNNTVTVPVPPSPTAKSGLPSPLKSPTLIDWRRPPPYE